MVNAWSLLYDEINGTLDEEYPIMTAKNENYDDFENPNPEQYNFTSTKVTEAKSDKDWQDFWKDDGYSITGNPYYGVDGGFSFASTPVTFGGGPDTLRIGPTRLQGGMGEDHIVVNPPKVDDVYAYHYPPKPPVNLKEKFSMGNSLFDKLFSIADERNEWSDFLHMLKSPFIMHNS